jgi:hypothetical protein
MNRKRPTSDTSVDCELGKRGVWLVKVPRYLSDQWQQQHGREVGRLETNPASSGDIIFRTTAINNRGGAIVTNAATSSQVATSSRSLAQKPATATPAQMPLEHKFIFSDVRSQTMAVMSEGKAPFCGRETK